MPHRPSLAVRLLIMVGPGILPALFRLAFFSRMPAGLFFRIALSGMVYSSFISGLCWLILPRVAPRILRRRRFRRWPVLVAIVIAIAVAGCLFASLFLLALGVTSRDDFFSDFLISMKFSILLTLIVALSSLFHEVVVDRLNAASRDAERLRRMATEARLSSLESRVQPHFLFNTLNSISALIRENPAQAERMVERLASLLRFSLDANSSRLVSLETELKLVRDYLDIEHARFGARLRYRIDVPPSMSAIEVPPMSIQTLVENSVKHAVSTSREGATIEVRARIVGNVPSIDVIDDGPGFDSSAVQSGHGLDLLQSRLAAILGAGASLQFASEAGRMRATVVLIPA